MGAYKAASGVVARWLIETTFAQPTVADIEALLREEGAAVDVD